MQQSNVVVSDFESNFIENDSMSVVAELIMASGLNAAVKVA